MAVKFFFVGLLLFVALVQTHSSKKTKDGKKAKLNVMAHAMPSKLLICNL